MDLTKVLEMLGAEKLDEAKQVTITETLTTIIEAKAKELSKEITEKVIAEEKEAMVSEFETKFNNYKEDVTSKFSNFVDSVLDEEMMIPEKVVRFARLGELYEDLIQQFKVRLAVDEGALSEEVKGMLSEAKTEITSLRKTVNELTGKTIEYEKDAKEMATHIYLRKKTDGLTESQKATVLDVLEGADMATIDKKFDVIVESLKPVTETVAPVVTESAVVVEPLVAPINEGLLTNTQPDMMAIWKQTLRENKI